MINSCSETSRKLPPSRFAETVRQVPLVLNAAGHLPFDGIERVRPDVIDQRREQLAIIGEQGQSGMRGKFLADLGAELAPAAHPAQRIVLGRQLERRRRPAPRGR